MLLFPLNLDRLGSTGFFFPLVIGLRGVSGLGVVTPVVVSGGGVKLALLIVIAARYSYSRRIYSEAVCLLSSYTYFNCIRAWLISWKRQDTYYSGSSSKAPDIVAFNSIENFPTLVPFYSMIVSSFKMR